MAFEIYNIPVNQPLIQVICFGYREKVSQDYLRS
jgi:hypothetical protein